MKLLFAEHALCAGHTGGILLKCTDGDTEAQRGSNLSKGTEQVWLRQESH